MHVWLALAALALTYIAPATAVTLQTFAPCEDLSPHCPALCASCEQPEEPVGFALDGPGSLEIDAPTHGKKPNATRPKRFVGTVPGQHASQQSLNGGQPSFVQHGKWIQIPSERPSWLPSWVPWWYKPRPGAHGTIIGGGPIGGSEQAPPSSGPVHIPELPTKECSNLVNGGRQLIEAFCPKSCGRCGRSTSPLAAAQSFITAQCIVAKGPVAAAATH